MRTARLRGGGCTISETDCAGSVYVSTAGLGAQFDEGRQTLHDCLGSATSDGSPGAFN